MKTTVSINLLPVVAVKMALEDAGIHYDEEDEFLKIRLEREGYDDNGFHEGTEYCVLLFPILKEIQNNLCISPKGFPNAFEKWIQLESNCINVKLYNPDPSDTYFPPDEEFWWQTWEMFRDNVIRDYMPEISFQSGPNPFWLMVSKHQSVSWTPGNDKDSWV